MADIFQIGINTLRVKHSCDIKHKISTTKLKKLYLFVSYNIKRYGYSINFDKKPAFKCINDSILYKNVCVACFSAGPKYA